MFNVKDASAETMTIGYRGGLSKTRKASESSSGNRRPLGPRRFGPRRGGFGPRIFSDNPFTGLSQSSNELTVTPQGEVRSLKGTSQLPYLIGNLSILFFEPLPETAQQQWSVRNGVSITEGGGRSSRPPFFRPSPFSRDEPEKRTAASETTSFAIERTEGDLIVVSKTYKLNMPAGGDDDASYEITGQGTWTFNRKLQAPESLNFKQKLFVHDKNTSTTVPVTIKYTRMSDEELEKHQKERQEQIAAARKQLEDRKRARESGIAAEEKGKILKDLKSDNKNAITRRMVQLKIVKPHPDDKDIALLIQKHLDDSHRPLRVMAQAAWKKWSVLIEEDAKPATNENPFALPQAAKMRTWKDSTGKFTIEAEFVRMSGKQVTLRRKDGKELSLPVDRLSEEDQAAARELAGKQ